MEVLKRGGVLKRQYIGSHVEVMWRSCGGHVEVMLRSWRPLRDSDGTSTWHPAEGGGGGGGWCETSGKALNGLFLNIKSIGCFVKDKMKIN